MNNCTEVETVTKKKMMRGAVKVAARWVARFAVAGAVCFAALVLLSVEQSITDTPAGGGTVARHG